MYNISYHLNQQHQKKMDSKMHRYMQRIQKLMYPTKKNISPIRPSKSPFNIKASQLDKYLRYELSTKIISTIITNNHKHFSTVFFNCIRNSEYRQKEKIYKFIAIEKQQKTKEIKEIRDFKEIKEAREIRVDLSSSCKMFCSILKNIIKAKFNHFMSSIKQPSQIRSSTQHFTNININENKPNGRSSKLIRTSSKLQKDNYKDTSQWIDDHQTLIERQVLKRKIENCKVLSVKVLIKLIGLKFKRLSDYAFLTIKFAYLNNKEKQAIAVHNKKIAQKQKQQKEQYNIYWINKENQYKDQIKLLNEKLRQIDQINRNTEINNEEQKEQNLQLVHQNHNFLPVLARQKWLQVKTTLIKTVQSISQTYSILNKTKYITYKVAQGMLLLNSFYLKNNKKIFDRIKGQIFRQRLVQDHTLRLANIVDILFTKQKLSSCHLLFAHLQSRINAEKIQNRSMNELEIKSANSRSNIRSLISATQTYNPILIKLNFYSFMDKVFKMILIFSKLLIPLKEAFLKIDFYASYSYRVQQSLKVVPLRYLKQAFEEIKSHQTVVKQYSASSNSNKNIPYLYNILETSYKERLIQSFSFIKIISKERDFKIKILPARENIIEVTKQFIIERDQYTSESITHWNNLKTTLLSSPGNPEKYGNEKLKRLFSA